MPGPRITRWWDEAADTHDYTVAPDGCRDLILVRRPGRAPRWQVADLDLTVSSGRAVAGTRFDGFRLAPGTGIDLAGLARALAGVEDAGTGAARLAEHLRPNAALDEGLAALAAPDCHDLRVAARSAGLSPRSLQRLVGQATGQGPHWWLRLARVRRAALALARMSPAEAAATEGYADQSHLTREMQHFLGVTPAAHRRGAGPAIHAGHGTHG